MGTVPVLLAETPVSIPAGVSSHRSRYRLAEGRFTVLTGFEPASDLARKNPWASIRAFQQAFAGRDDAQLVVKLTNAGGERPAKAAVVELERLADQDTRVFLIKERLSLVELLNLYASCDVTISLHRAEGLGLMPLEGMRLGKPTICTGWSGNMTYMSHANSVPVRYRLRPTNHDSIHYSPRAAGVASFWAELDVEHAVAALRHLASDEEARTALSARALADAAAYHQRALEMGFIDEVVSLQQRAAWSPRPDWQAIAEQLLAMRAESNWRALSRMAKLSARVRWRLDALASRAGADR